ncbi:MAG: hypothetical protein RR662_03905 [Clostridia bacterium]
MISSIVAIVAAVIFVFIYLAVGHAMVLDSSLNMIKKIFLNNKYEEYIKEKQMIKVWKRKSRALERASKLLITTLITILIVNLIV